MPTRRTHILVGSPTGAVYAAHRAKSRPRLGDWCKLQAEHLAVLSVQCFPTFSSLLFLRGTEKAVIVLLRALRSSPAVACLLGSRNFVEGRQSSAETGPFRWWKMQKEYCHGSARSVRKTLVGRWRTVLGVRCRILKRIRGRVRIAFSARRGYATFHPIANPRLLTSILPRRYQSRKVY